MTRISGSVGRLLVVIAALTAVALVALPAAAAELPFVDSSAVGRAVVVGAPEDVGPLMPGDAAPPQMIEIGGKGQVEFRATARVSDSTAVAHCLHARITAIGSDVVLYDGPLEGATVSGNTGEHGRQIAVLVSMEATAGNDAQGGQVSVSWDVTTSDTSGN